MLHSVLYMGAPVHVALHMDLNWEVGRIALASAVNLNHLQVRVFRITSGSPYVETGNYFFLYKTVVRLQLILFSQDIGAF